VEGCDFFFVGGRGVRSGQPSAFDSLPQRIPFSASCPVPDSNHSPAASASTSRGLGKRHAGRWPLVWFRTGRWVLQPQIECACKSHPAQAAEASLMNGRERVGRKAAGVARFARVGTSGRHSERAAQA